MRRSAAPSARKSNSLFVHQSVNDNKVRSTSSVLQILNGNQLIKTEIVNDEKKPKQMIKKSDLTSYIRKNVQEDSNEPECDVNPNNPSDEIVYNIVWGKKTTKKHKTWEGDGTLIVRQRSVTVKDEEGKTLGTLSNVKTDLFEEGYILSLGGKEVQIIELAPNVSANKKRPSSSVFNQNVTQPPKKIVKRNFLSRKISNDSNNPSLVLPQPSLEHQWSNNAKKLAVTDVVINSGLAKILRPHQHQGVIFLYECVMGYRIAGQYGAILADEMGLGKTLQCITLIWTLLKQGPYGGLPVIKKALVVVPSSLTGNWKKEFMHWLGREKIQVFIVDSKNKPSDYRNKFLHIPVMIISYEMFARSIEQMQDINFDLMICDEGHRLKNDSIKLTTFLNKLDCKRRIILTGTPIQNDLQEFYSLANFVNPGILGNAYEYRKTYIEPITASREPNISEDCKKLGEERAAELNKKTSIFVLRRTQDILEKFLPTKTEMVVFCKSSDLQKRLYRAVVECWQNRENKEVAHLSVIIALKKICNHPCLLKRDDIEDNTLMNSLQYIVPDLKRVHIKDSKKLQVLASLLERLQFLKEKIVIVSLYTQTLDLISELCDQRQYKYARLDGGTATGKRMNIVEKFNDPKNDCLVFLLSAKAGGVGLNLVGASRLVLFDSDWNPATDLQAMARVWRDGQKKSVYLYRFLTAGTIEEKIYQRQISKVGLSGAIVDPKNTSSIRLSAEDLKDLFSLDQLEDNICSTHLTLGCSCLCNGNIPEPRIVNSDNSTERKCQLGASETAVQETGLRMNQLMQWEHYKPPIESQVLHEAGLFETRECISFMFRNKCNL